ncbi:unnamed protein product [Larinioides sclopetarius]|uniref:DUF5641 domain-containing protein n=1 Tax=Larinioides sclopetarius TaxID=280406 RepID=A0AAV1ZYG9_9ARAC
MSDLRIRFRNEYLSQLHQRSTVRNQVYIPKIGDVVLLWNDNQKRIHWPLGRILSIYASRDGIARRAKIKTKSGIMIRPIRKLCPLELDGEGFITNEDKIPDTPNPDPDTTPDTPDPDRNAPGDPERQDNPESTTVITRAGRPVRPPSRYSP